jgi:hypothetical protein
MDIIIIPHPTSSDPSSQSFCLSQWNERGMHWPRALHWNSVTEHVSPGRRDSVLQMLTAFIQIERTTI